MKVVGFAYRGTKNTTRSGFSCQKWSAQKPHKHDYNKPEDNPHAGLVENYCRNPDLEPDGPWCYTTSPSKRWEYCDIEMCSRGMFITPPHSSYQDVNTPYVRLIEVLHEKFAQVPLYVIICTFNNDMMFRTRDLH